MEKRNRYPWHLLLEKFLVALFVLLDGVALIKIAPNDRLWAILVTISAVALVFVIFINFFRENPPKF
jgi:hypothetical protein